jgi:ribosome-binding protein aMBF1 (putative translation factor)
MSKVHPGIQEVMRVKGWSHKRLAQEMGVTEKTIRKMEACKQYIPRSFAKKLATIPLWTNL